MDTTARPIEIAKDIYLVGASDQYSAGWGIYWIISDISGGALCREVVITAEKYCQV